MPQVRVGWRANTGQAQAAQSVSTLLASLYGAWNGDAATNEFDKSLFGAWNGEAINNLVVKNAWNANGNANDSKGGANGTVAIPSGTTFTTGSMTYSAGKLGSGAFTFDGTNFINLPDNTLKFTGDFSISCWFYVPTNYVSNTNLISAFDNKSSYTTYYGWSFGYNSTNKNIGFSIGNPAGGSYANVSLSTTNNSIVPGQWNHVIVTRKMGTRSRIYINGVLSASNTSTMNPTYNFGLSCIGASFYAFSQPYYTKANAGLKIDSIYTFEAELDDVAVSELYNSGTGQEYPFTISNALISTPIDNVGTNHGTLQGGATYTTGKIGSAFSFNGSTSYVQLPTDSFKPTGNFAVSFWLNLYSLNAVRSVFSNCPQSNMGFRVTIGSNNKINFEYNGYSFVSNSTLTSNTWYHICVMNTGTTYEIYINGALDRTNAGSSPWYAINWAATGNLFYIGRYVTAAYYLNGAVDSFTLWNRSLSKDEITQLYNSGTGAQYPFTGTFSSAANALGMDNGTLMNGCYLSDGKIGKAFTFDGVNDYVQLPNNSLNFTTFSISAWVNPSNTVGSRTILNSANYVSALDYGWKFRIIDGQLSLQIYSTGGLINEYKGGSISTNTWTHVSATRINGSTKLYINGNLVGSQTSGSINNIPNFTTTTYCSIGSLTSAVAPISFFIGSIDSLSVWQKELTQAEVTELYNSGNGKQITATPIVQTGLVLNLDASRTSSYPGTGTTWTDISGSGNNGTMVNGPIFGTASGGVISLDGVNDYIDFGNNTTLYNSYNSSFTQEFAIRLKSNATTDKTIFRVDDWSRISTQISTSQFKFIIGYNNGGTPTDTLIYNGTFAYNQWYIITTVWSKLNTQKIYINGVLVAQRTPTVSTYTGIAGTSGGANIGRGHSDPYANNLNFDISTFRHYNRALTDIEITQNYNATKTRFGL